MNSAVGNATRGTGSTRRTITGGGMHKFFAWMESTYGGSLPMDQGQHVITSPTLKGDDLHRLFRHEVTALHVPGFYDPQCAAEWGRELASDVVAAAQSSSASNSNLRNWKVSTSRGLESSDVSTLGEHPPYNVVAATAAVAAAAAAATGNSSSSKSDAIRRATDEYFDGVLREFRSRRQPRQRRSGPSTAPSLATSGAPSSSSAYSAPAEEWDSACYPPRLWPLDLLRLELDEAWPGGAGLAREKSSLSRPYGGGLPRIMVGPTRWKRGFIHVDEMGPLNASSGLFSANIYLQLPDPDPSTLTDTKGPTPPVPVPRPVLHVWPLGIRSRWDWYRNAVLLSGMSSQDPEAQMRLWKELGTPLTVAVAPGDLVVLCVQRPHCAIGFQSGIRVSLQCFLQYQGSKERLLIDC